MTRTIRHLLAALLLTIAFGPALAFCVHNDTKREILASQTTNEFSTGFSKTIKTGQKACCNWQNKDCNPKGKIDTELLMYVRGEHIGAGGAWGCGKDMGSNETVIKLPAGGAVYVKPNPDYVKKGTGKRIPPVETAVPAKGSVPAIPLMPTTKRMYPDKAHVVAVYTAEGKLFKVFPCPAYDKPDEPEDFVF
jgi:hypothetical protein